MWKNVEQIGKFQVVHGPQWGCCQICSSYIVQDRLSYVNISLFLRLFLRSEFIIFLSQKSNFMVATNTCLQKGDFNLRLPTLRELEEPNVCLLFFSCLIKIQYILIWICAKILSVFLSIYRNFVWYVFRWSSSILLLFGFNAFGLFSLSKKLFRLNAFSCIIFLGNLLDIFYSSMWLELTSIFKWSCNSSK